MIGSTSGGCPVPSEREIQEFLGLFEGFFADPVEIMMALSRFVFSQKIILWVCMSSFGGCM